MQLYLQNLYEFLTLMGGFPEHRSVLGTPEYRGRLRFP